MLFSFTTPSDFKGFYRQLSQINKTPTPQKPKEVGACFWIKRVVVEIPENPGNNLNVLVIPRDLAEPFFIMSIFPKSY